jgi:long-subunit fatty acid transport protein
VLAFPAMAREGRFLLALALLLAAPPALAQGNFFLPPSAVLTNYDRVLIGQEEALESGAFVARVADSTAGWYNPAGLALVKRSVIGASATGYELTSIDLGQIQTSAGKVTLAQLPSYFGAVLGGDVIASDRWRIGFSATKPTSWATAVNGASLDGGSVNYSSRVNISTLVPAISAAWAVLPSLRIGAGVGVAITSISQTQILTMHDAPPGGSVAVQRSADGTGTTWGGQGSLGVQWDVTDRLAAGASLRTPTFAILRTGSLSFQDIESINTPSGPGSVQSYFTDPNVSFTYKLPLTLNFGLAWREPTFDVEVDVRYHTAIPRYALMSSSEQVERIVIQPGGQETRTLEPFPEVSYEATAVWNFAIGGRYQLDPAWSIHGGFYTDAAPTNQPTTNVFRSVNLYGFTAGAKLKGDHLSGSLGLGFSWGSSDEIVLAEPSGNQVSMRLAILSVSLLYAIAYRF